MSYYLDLYWSESSSDKQKFTEMPELTFSTYTPGISYLSKSEKKFHFSVTYLCLLDLSYALFNDPEPKEM